MKFCRFCTFPIVFIIMMIMTVIEKCIIEWKTMIMKSVMSIIMPF